MDSKNASESSSRVDPIDNLEPALLDMTETLIPNYLTEIQNTEPAELESVLAQLTATALTTPLKDKELSTMLGKMAVVMFTQLRHFHSLLNQLSAKLRGHKHETRDLLEENQSLKGKLESTQQALTRAE